MHDIGLRLPGQKATQALREGGTALDAGFPDWITLDAFDAQIPIAVKHANGCENTAGSPRGSGGI